VAMAITMTTMTMQLPKWVTHGINPKTLPLHKVCGGYSLNFLVLHQIYVLKFASIYSETLSTKSGLKFGLPCI
jgi:hypothetical protein